MRTLKLTPNPAPAKDSSTDRAPFVCPLSLKEMNGSQPFIYIATCGCVMSQAGLKALAGSSGSTPPAEGKEVESQLDICPQCSKKYDKREDIRMINPDPETEAAMRIAMELRREKAKASKPKKRKAAEAKNSAGGTPTPDDDSGKSKKSKTTAAPSVNPTVAAASRAVASSLAMEEAKRKANMSEAVKSLYESKNKEKETFMTRATFTRVSLNTSFRPCHNKANSPS